MPEDQWDKVGALLEEVSTVPPDQRQAFLEEHCEDESLREEVRSLLALLEEADGFFEGLESAVPSSFRDSIPEPQEEEPVSDPLDLKGSRVGRYVVSGHLGGGGMGIVYQARDPDLGRAVALKFLPPYLAASEEAERRFAREARAAARLEHPHIATIHEIGKSEKGLRFIAMAYYEGETLKEKLAREGALPLDEAIGYVRQIAEALSAAHGAGIVHRDVKPANVMVTEDGSVKLLDFGLARAAAETGLTETGRRLGTAAYMSPEQARGEEVGPATDLWALGVVLYEMLAGERPFSGERPSAVLQGVLHEEPDLLRTHREEAGPELERVVRRCLQKDPAERYDSAEALLEDLRVSRSGEDLSPRRYWNSLGTSGDGARPRWTLGGVTVALLVLSVALGWAIWGNGSPIGSIVQLQEDSSLAPNRVAVFPFTVRGKENLSHLSSGMVELLSRSVSGGGDIETVDVNALLGRLEKSSPGTVSPAEARRIAADLGAGRYVLGSVLRLGDRLRLSATWYEAEGSKIGSAEAIGDGEREIQSMIDTLARAAIADLAQGDVGGRQQLAAQTTFSSEALKAYLKGQAALRAFNYQAAIDPLSTAVEEDSTFALAHYRLSLAVGWAGQLQRAHRHARRAAELSGELPKQDRRLLRANEAFYFGEAEEAERLYRTVLQNHPDDAWAHYMLGETLFHFNGVRGRPVMEARRPLRRALELDPSSAEPLPHLVTLASMEGDRARIDSLTSGLRERGLPPLVRTTFRAVRAHVLSDGPSPALRKRLQEDPIAAWGGALSLWAGEHLEAASEMVDPLTSPERPDEMRAGMLTKQAELLAAQGRIQTARQKLQAVAALDSAAYWMARARLAALPFLPERTGREQTDVRMGLSSWNAETVPERLLPPRFLLPRELYPAGRLYRIGLLRAQAGQTEEALRAAHRLERMDGTILTPSGPADFSRSIRAEVERRRNRTKKALAHLEARENRVGQAPVFFSLHSGARERFLRAELLAQEGRLEEALQWYRTLNGIAWGDLPYLAPAHLGRARVLERLDRDEEAARAYRQGLKLWSEADPEFQPRIEDARSRLDALKRVEEAK